MGNTLQDQLLKAGLANKKQAVRAKKAKNNKEKLQRSGVQVTDEAAEAAREAERLRVERDKQLNQEKNAAAQKKAVAAQIRQLIEMNQIERSGDQTFSFDHQGVIKSVQVDQAQRQQLASGSLAVAEHAGGYAVIRRVVAEKIMQRDASCIVCLHDQADDAVVDDEYAEYQVPDDLMW